MARMLFVVDEFGSVIGIVTLHDVFEVLAGDVPEPENNVLSEKMLEKQKDGSCIVPGSLPAVPNYKTVAGLVLSKLKYLPRSGDKLTFDGWTIEILDTDARSIKMLHLTPSEENEAD